MQTNSIFDQPFYRGVFEVTTANKLQVARVTFGTQPPTMAQLQWLITNRWLTLHWTQPTTLDYSIECQSQQVKLKRARREVKRRGNSRPAQTVLKLAHQQNLREKKRRRKLQRQTHQAEVRLKRRAKHLAKHRGH